MNGYWQQNAWPCLPITTCRRACPRRTGALSKASGASKEAKAVVNELQSRLVKEMEEREVEAAMYNARLYENERQQGDWYVEKRLLEKRIEELDAEVTKLMRVHDVS